MKWWVESDFKAPNLPLSLRLKCSGCHYNKCIKLRKSTKMSKIFFLSMCDVRVFLTFTSLNLVLLWQLFYLLCSNIVINTVIVIYDFKIEVVPFIINFSTELTTVVKFEVQVQKWCGRSCIGGLFNFQLWGYELCPSSSRFIFILIWVGVSSKACKR
jgi:hypothetical protein